MLREKKTQIIAQVADELSRSTIVIATSYQGLPAKEMTELRRALGGAAAHYHVVKNTLTRFAAQRVDKEQVMSIVDGPTALAFGYGDVVEVIKVLSQYIKSTDLAMQIKGGLLGKQVLSADEVVALAGLPPREILISQLIAQVQAPIGSLHNVLSSPLRGLCYVLQARVQSFIQ